jgi:CRP-like cAMP-binding protein
LGSHPFLTDLDSKYIAQLAAFAQRRTFQPGDYLWRQGDPADVLFLMQSGEVALEISIPHQGPLPFETLVGSEILGWSWLVPPYRYRFDARAVSIVEVFALDGKSIRNSCNEDQGLGYQLLKRLTPLIAHRLEMALLRLLELTRV